MEWFHHQKSGIESATKRDTPGDLWVKCENCKEIVYTSDWEETLAVCPACGHHHRFSVRDYASILLDEGTFVEEDATVAPADPLKFSAKKKYRDSVVSAQKSTGEKSAVLSGTGAMDGRQVSLAMMDFRFLGGSMGSAEGEKIARALLRGLERRIPAIVVSASGGARMHEGTLSLMQMAKTSSIIGRMREAGVPYISVLTNPTTGGVTASFAMLGDAIISEPGALIGFAGERVIRETIRQALPDGFQRAEFLLKHGFLDDVVPRKELKSWISRFLGLLTDSVP
ncbi:MAG TPA: acetyl-CoA carboxylase, carboxyltransferase subunit beta [Fibrobacteria bacterium]|nr:acetyl-CoA carboxylase, carboxyltransferase subunit beta [Fibrobacteria bacterium]HOX50263.1 acetyl-CoA carboxylase, carboxyltransferase subunit beta [Fibrobacteria bacterium]